MSNERSPTQIDIFVGNKIKTRRIELGLSQETLANSLNISFQQVQKYEKGFNRIGASRLFSMSELLSVPVAYFFEGLKHEAPNNAPSLPPIQIAELLSSTEAVELLTLFSNQKSKTTRKKIIELIKIL